MSRGLVDTAAAGGGGEMPGAVRDAADEYLRGRNALADVFGPLPETPVRIEGHVHGGAPTVSDAAPVTMSFTAAVTRDESIPTGTGDGAPLAPALLDGMTETLDRRLASLAAEGTLAPLLTRIFGDRADAADLATGLATDGVALPERVLWVDPSILRGARGAYASEGGGTLLLSQDLAHDPAALLAVFAEEIGHHLDRLLGGEDAVGDEGAIFAHSLLTPADRISAPLALDGPRLVARERTQDDRAEIFLDGERVAVEFSGGAYGGEGSPVYVDGQTPNANDLDIEPDRVGREAAGRNAETATRVRGHLIASDGNFYQIDRDIWEKMSERDLIIRPESTTGPTFEGRVVMVNGVTVSPFTALQNARLLSEQTGNEVLPVYNGPHLVLTDFGGREREFFGALNHSNQNERLTDQRATDNVAQLVVDQVTNPQEDQKLTLVLHSEGGSYGRAGLDVAKERLKAMNPSLGDAEIESLIDDNVRVVSLGAGSSRFPEGAAATHYFHLDDGVTGGLGLARQWGSDSRVIFSIENEEGAGAFANHGFTTYVGDIAGDDRNLPPGVYFRDDDGATYELAIERVTVGPRTRYQLVALGAGENGEDRVVRVSGDDSGLNAVRGDRLAGLWRTAETLGVEPKALGDQPFAIRQRLPLALIGPHAHPDAYRQPPGAEGADDGASIFDQSFSDNAAMQAYYVSLVSSGFRPGAAQSIVLEQAESLSPVDFDQATLRSIQTSLIGSTGEVTRQAFERFGMSAGDAAVAKAVYDDHVARTGNAEDAVRIVWETYIDTPDGTGATGGQKLRDYATDNGIALPETNPLPRPDIRAVVPEGGSVEVAMTLTDIAADAVTALAPGAGVLTEDQQAFRDRANLLNEGVDDPGVRQQNVDRAFAEYVIGRLDDPSSPGLTNRAGADARFAAATAGGKALDETAFHTVYDTVYGTLSGAFVTLGDPHATPAEIEAARATLEDESGGRIEITPDGRIRTETNDGTAALVIGQVAGDIAADEGRNAEVAGQIAADSELDARVAAAIDALPENARTPEAVAAAIEGVLLEADADGIGLLADPAALRDATREKIDVLAELGGNEAAVAFLRSFDLILGAIEAAGADFTGSAIGDFLQTGSGSLGYFLERIGAGDGAAWSALSADLGAFAASLDDGRREAFAESAYGFTVAGRALVLAGSGQEPSDALIVSGELISIAGEGMLAAAGKSVPGFGAGVEVSPEMAVGAGFGRLLGRYADDTDTKLDDVAGLLLEEGLPALAAFEADDVYVDGELALDNDLAGASMVAAMAGSALEVVIDGRVGEILGGVADGASTGLALAAGAINPAQAVVGFTTAVFDIVGVDVPPEAQTGALVAMAAANASNPVGWVALAVQLGVQIAGMKTWTEVTDIAPGIDADADFRFDDTGQIATDFHSNFWGRVKVDDGRIQYEVNGVNPDLLESATFDLSAETEMALSTEDDDDDGFTATLTINGVEHEGRIIADGERVNVRGYTGSGDGREKIYSAEFVSRNGEVRVPVRVSEHGHDDYDDAYGASFSLAEGAEDAFPPRYRLSVQGTYAGLNPVTDGVGFYYGIYLTPEQYETVAAELGGTEPVTLDGQDPRLQGVDGETELMRIMAAQSVTFDSAEKDPNLYQYMDVTGDGNLDLIRYGIRQDKDGLHSGDERYEVTILGPDRQDLGLPTIKTDDLNRAAEIGTLTPYLFAWAASRPETGRVGHDPVSLHSAAAAAGDLDALKELHDIDLRLKADVAAADRLLRGDEIADDAWQGFTGSLQTSEADIARRTELAGALDLFDTGAYEAAHPDLQQAFGGDPMRLAAHYLTTGNGEGRAIDTAGTVLPVGPEAAIEGAIVIGETLRPGQRMQAGDMLMSESGRFATIFEDDGRFVTYDLSGAEPVPVWEAERTGNTDDGYVKMQADGNFVIYDNDDDDEFATGTYSEDANRAFEAQLGDDGVLRVLDPLAEQTLWTSSEGLIAAAAPDEAVLVSSPEGEAHREAITTTDAGALTYLASNPAIAAAWDGSGEDPVIFARRHFEEAGHMEAFAMDFDATAYISAPGNEDLVAAFWGDETAALNHYVTGGRAEHLQGLRPHIGLDGGEPNRAALVAAAVLDTDAGALRYVASSPDLVDDAAAKGIADRAGLIDYARLHFLSSGWAEDRPLDFDAGAYLTNNADLAAAFGEDAIAGLEHFIVTGHAEGRHVGA